MQGNALDEFIVEFEHLRSEAGWSSNDIGTIMQFQRGLNTRLLKAIVQHVCPRLRTLREWFDAAREQHNIWNELKAVIEDAKSTSPPAPPRRSMTYTRPSNAMDIDAVHVDALAAKEKDRLAKEGRCFKCKKQGHISRKCPEREENKNAPRRGNQGMTPRATAVEESGKDQNRVEELAGGIRELGEDEREGFLNHSRSVRGRRRTCWTMALSSLVFRLRRNCMMVPMSFEDHPASLRRCSNSAINSSRAFPCILTFRNFW